MNNPRIYLVQLLMDHKRYTYAVLANTREEAKSKMPTVSPKYSKVRIVSVESAGDNVLISIEGN